MKIKKFRFFEISKFSKFLIFHMIFNIKKLRYFSRFFQDFENFRKKSNFFANARIEKKMIYFQLSLMRYKWFLEVFLASGQFFDWLESKCPKREGNHWKWALIESNFVLFHFTPVQRSEGPTSFRGHQKIYISQNLEFCNTYRRTLSILVEFTPTMFGWKHLASSH